MRESGRREVELEDFGAGRVGFGRVAGGERLVGRKQLDRGKGSGKWLSERWL